MLGVDLAVEPTGAPRPDRRRSDPAPRSAAARSATRPAAARSGRPAAAPGHVPGRRPGRAGRRCAGWSRRPTCAGERGDAGEHPRPGRRARSPARRRRWCCSGPASELGPGGHAAPRRPRPGRCCAAGARWSTAPTSWSSWSPTGCPAAGPGLVARTPPGWPGSPGAPGSARCSPTRSATPTAPTPRPSTSSTPPAGWSPLDLRHVDRGNAEGFLKSGKEMPEVAEEICRLRRARRHRRRGPRLLARTRAVADRCALDPRADLGLGEVHFPEFELVGRAAVAARSTPGRPRDGAAAGRAARAAIGRPLRLAPRGSGSGSGSTTSWR